MRLLERLSRWRSSRATRVHDPDVENADVGDAHAERRAAAAEAEARRNSDTYSGGGRGPGSRLPGGF